jgi:hypothetical protein
VKSRWAQFVSAWDAGPPKQKSIAQLQYSPGKSVLSIGKISIENNLEK